MLRAEYIYFRSLLVIVEGLSLTTPWIIRSERPPRAVDIVIERIVRWYWFEYVAFKDRDHVTMSRRGRGTMHLCQMHSRIIYT